MFETYFRVEHEGGSAALFEVYPDNGFYAGNEFLIYGPKLSGNEIATIDMIADMGRGRRVPQVNRDRWSTKAPPSRDSRGRKIDWDR